MSSLFHWLNNTAVRLMCRLCRELKRVFSALRQRCHNQRSQDVCDQLVSSCVFLRFICPAVLSPTLFGFAQQLPTEKVSRNTTLVAKTIQSLANFSRWTERVWYVCMITNRIHSVRVDTCAVM